MMNYKTDKLLLHLITRQYYFLLGSVFISCIFSGCSGTKFLKENESFYTGSEINIRSHGKVSRRKNLTKKLEEFITPKPNTVVLGSRPGVWFFYKGGGTTDPKIAAKQKRKGFKYFVRTKLGQPPVLISDVKTSQTSKLLHGQLYNNGFFDAHVQDTIVTKRKRSKVIYTVDLQRPYRLRNIVYPKGRDSVYAHILSTVKEESLLDSNQRYSLERMQAEQARIEAAVENYGFYYFDDRYLIFEADSTEGNRQVDLDLKMEKGIPDKAKRIYKLDQVYVYPNFSLTRDTTNIPFDTVRLNGLTYIDNTHSFRPKIVTDVINLRQHDIYTRDARELTLSHLMGLGTFKFVNIKYTDSPKDSFALDASIYLTPLLKNSIRVEFQAISKSNNFVGPGLSVTFTNRNFFKGAELFQLRLNTGYEWQIGGGQGNAVNSYEIGIETSLAVPRFITPIKINYNSKRYLPQTRFSLGYSIQERVTFFRLTSITANLGYTWRESTSKTHSLFPIDLTYVQLGKTSDAFQDRLKNNQVLANAFQNQFIPGLRYSFTLNTQLTEERPDKFTEQTIRKSNFYFNGNIDIAGNLVRLYQNNITKPEDDPYKIFGSSYSQYVKNDIDFRYYWQPDVHNKIATRLIIGGGYPFGNSTTLPYIKQFSIGGANSIRAFPARSLGPGTYNVREDKTIRQNANGVTFMDQRGDIKLEGNVEYRFDIYKFVKGALFIDAGNIWLWKSDSARSILNPVADVVPTRVPGGKFNINDFHKELAVGTGFGLRFDFSFFVLRLDLGIPLRKPYLPESKRWVIKDIDFGSSTWRNDNLLFNIAIGYPF